MKYNKALFDGMVLFCTVVEQTGFCAGARLLGHTPSHVSKEIAKLEARLGTRLLNRTTRRISLTETGRIYFENARRIVGEAHAVEDRILTLGDRPFGELKMTVPLVFADNCFNAWLPEFIVAFPDVALDIEVSEHKVDLILEAFDLAVRIGTLPASDLVSRQLFATDLMTVASQDYLDRHGCPQTPHELSEHILVDFSLRTAAHVWTFPARGRGTITVAVAPRFRCNNAQMEKALALSGKGITRLPRLACEEELLDGRLVRILEDYEPDPAGIHVVYPSRNYLPPKTRAMIDFLIKKCQQRTAVI